MGQSNAYQPLIVAIDDARRDFIEFEKGFDRFLSDVVIDGSSKRCSDLLETDNGSIFNINGFTEKTVIDSVRVAGSKLIDGIDQLFGDDFLVNTGNSVDDFTQFICVTVNSTTKLAFELLQTRMSVPILLIDKLLKTLDKLMTALTELSDILMGCVLDKVTMVQNFINNLIPRPGSITALSDAIDSCPQLYCYMVDTFKPICKSKSFSNTQGLLECVRDSITVPLNTLFEEYIITVIKDLVAAFLDKVESARQWLVKKIRDAIRNYIKALYKKREIPDGIRWLLTSVDNCDGPEEASIMDIMYAMRSFSQCVDSVCDATSASMKRDIQEINDSLHLSFSYWKKFGVGYDLFLLLERAEIRDSVGNTARGDVIRKPGGVAEQVSSTRSVVEVFNQELDSPVDVSTDISSIISNAYSDEKTQLEDAGTILSNGTRLFREGVEDELLKIYQNLSSEIYIYENKYNEFSRWDAEYYKDSLNTEKQRIAGLIDETSDPDELTGEGQFLSTNSVRSVPYIRQVESTYSTQNNDYKPLSNDAIQSREDGQGTLAMYAAWYATLEG